MGKYRTLGTKFDNVYRNDLNANFDEIDKDIKAETSRAKTKEDEIDNRVTNVDERISNIISQSGTSDTEVVDARGGHAVLRDRLNQVDAHLAQRVEEISISTVFQKNVDFNSKYFRIPTNEITNNGEHLVAADARYYGSSDNDVSDIVMARSLDGKTWFDKKVVIRNNGIVSRSRKTNSMFVVNRNTNRVFLFFLAFDMDKGWTEVTDSNEIVWDFGYIYSDDDGDTWSNEVSLKHLFTGDPTVDFVIAGCGKGIQMTNGTLVAPIQVKNKNNEPHQLQSSVITSPDGGLTWEWNGVRVPARTSECNVIEHEPGKLLLNARGNIQVRRIFESPDLGNTWTPHISDKTLLEPGACQGSFDKLTIGNKDIALFINPNSQSGRKNIQLRASLDYVNYFPVHTLHKGNTDGYSCLTNYQGKIAAVIERTGDIEFHDLSGLKLNVAGEGNEPFKGYQKATLDENGILRVTPDAKFVFVDVEASASNTLKGIERCNPNQELFISNFSTGFPLYFECATDSIPFNSETIPVDGIYKLKTTTGFLNSHTIKNEIKNNEWLQVSINAKFAEFVNIKDFAIANKDNPKVGEVILTADGGTSIQFTGLDVNYKGLYELVLNARIQGSSAGDLRMFYGSGSSSNYTSVRKTTIDGVETIDNTGSSNVDKELAGNRDIFIVAKIGINDFSNRGYCQLLLNDSSSRVVECFSRHNVDLTQRINTITINLVGGDITFRAGTKAILYRRG